MWELIQNWRFEKDRWYMSKFEKLEIEEIQEGILRFIKAEEELRQNE